MNQAIPRERARPPSSPALAAARMVFDLIVPLALFYGLREMGVGIYLALLAGALASGVTAVVVVATQRRLDAIAIFVLTTMLLSVGVSLLTGSERFLLAKEGWLTAVTGLWFLGSLRARRPMAFQFSRPLLEGRLGWPADWDTLWEQAPRFRRMWRISTTLWATGTLLDSVARVVMAYTLPVDIVPALSSVMYAVTSAVLIGVTNLYYRAAGAYAPDSALYRPEPPAPQGTPGRHPRRIGLQFRADPHRDRFFALRTRRRDGSTRSTPIWLAPSDGRWYAYTPGRSWKVERIRHDARVWVAAATFHGEPLGPWQPGHAQILPRSRLRAATRALTGRYGTPFRLFRLLTLVGALRRRGGPAVGLEITLAGAPLPSRPGDARSGTPGVPGVHDSAGS